MKSHTKIQKSHEEKNRINLSMVVGNSHKQLQIKQSNLKAD